MRAALGLISLLVVLAVVALLTRKTLPPPAVAPVPDMPATVTTPAQAQQVQEQYRKALDQAMQQARPASVDY